MPSINDILYAWLQDVTGLQGLSINDQLARIVDLNYMIPPRTATDPVNPPIGATWTNTTTGKVMMMTAQGIEAVSTEPAP